VKLSLQKVSTGYNF